MTLCECRRGPPGPGIFIGRGLRDCGRPGAVWEYSIAELADCLASLAPPSTRQGSASGFGRSCGVGDTRLVSESLWQRSWFPNRRCAHFAPSVVNRSLQGLCRDGSSETSMPGVASDLRVREV